MNVLVLGSGGREHSICLNISKSNKLKSLWCIPGNAGTKSISKSSNIDLKNHEEVINFCKKKKINIVIPGSEEYLESGIADSLRLSDILVFGPTKESTKLESSKIFTKKICDISNIKTAKWKLFNNAAEAINKIKSFKFPLVIKLDSLAAGKGVLVANSLKESKVFLQKVKDGLIGKKTSKIIIEEKLVGEEASFFFIADGQTASYLGSAKDYKRVGDNNTGLNTGGMGCISPSPKENNKNINTVLNKFILPTLKTMNNLGYPFKGILYAGLMFTKKGIYLIEYNVRLGDPECQSIFSRLKSDFLNIALMTEKHKLGKVKIRLDKKKSLCIVLASKGYPEKYKTGYEIQGLNNIKDSSVNIYHAGTAENNKKQTITNGGRVLNIVIREKTLESAIFKGYNLIKKIKCSNIFFRNDIGS